MPHLAFLAAAKAAASCGRLSRASAPFPVSNSADSSMMVSDSAAQSARLLPFAPQSRAQSAAAVAWKLEDMRRRAPYKRHTTVCPLVVAPFRAMTLLFSCCSSADKSNLFLPLCDMRSQAALRSKFFPALLNGVSSKRRTPRPSWPRERARSYAISSA